jgi:acetyl esterase/lipase
MTPSKAIPVIRRSGVRGGRHGVAAYRRRVEGLSHAQYTINPDAPETREAFDEIARFFDRHMQR